DDGLLHRIIPQVDQDWIATIEQHRVAGCISSSRGGGVARTNRLAISRVDIERHCRSVLDSVEAEPPTRGTHRVRRAVLDGEGEAVREPIPACRIDESGLESVRNR